MLRQLLTVLALISGLAAWAEPAQAARIASDIATSSEAEQGSSCAISHSGLVAEGIGSAIQRPEMKNFCPRPVLALLAPSVLLKADRARE